MRQVQQRLAGADVEHLPRLLRVLERIGDAGTLGTVRNFLRHEVPDVSIAAVDAVGVLLDSTDATVASDALDALTAIVLDRSCAEAIRLRAFDVIASAAVPSATYEADIVDPLREQLRRDPSEAVRHAADNAVPTALDVTDGHHAGPRPEIGLSAGADDAPAQLEAAAAGQLPADPAVLRALLGSHGATVPLTVVHRLIERIRAHEATLEAGALEQWRVTRSTAHLVLAARGSRLAVYDLRETLEALGEHTPVGMLSSLQQVGDAPALEALADAHASTTNAWFRGQLAGIFQAIVEREKLTKRQATIRKIAARLPETMEELWS